MLILVDIPEIMYKAIQSKPDIKRSGSEKAILHGTLLPDEEDIDKMIKQKYRVEIVPLST